MAQMKKSQSLSNREFLEFLRTLETFNLSGFIRGVMGHLNKRRGLLSRAVALLPLTCVEGVYILDIQSRLAKLALFFSFLGANIFIKDQ